MNAPSSLSAKPWQSLAQVDPEIYNLIEKERTRQEEGIELIASENFASAESITAMGSILNNKYAEGLPGKRYYGGCEHVDVIENLAIDRCKQLFGAAYANVQPHSGAQANAAAFLALLKGGDKILGMDLSHGGHLTHGSKVNFSGLLYESHFYSVDLATGRLDYDKVRDQAKAVKPRLIIAGASAYARQIDFATFREIADEVGAYLLVDMAHIAGLVAAGLHPSPVPHAHVVTSTTHKTLRGPRGGIILWNDKELNFNKATFPGTQGGPLEHIIASKAVALKEALDPSFKSYQQQVLANAVALADGLIAKGFKLVSGGTDNHLVLIDLSGEQISGKDLEQALDACHIATNKNTVPGEQRSPFVTSGVRLGTPAVTSRGMKEPEMAQIASWIAEVKAALPGTPESSKIMAEVKALTKSFPIYSHWL